MAKSEQSNSASAVTTEQEGSLLDQVMSQTRMSPAEEGYDTAKKGVAEFIRQLVKSGDSKISRGLVDNMIVELDRRIGAQVDEVLHNESFQSLESSWRGLKLLVDRTDFRENIKIDVLHATKDELLEDFEFAPEITQSGLYQHVYSAGYGQFGGEPVGAIIGNYAFTPSSRDMKLLQYTSSVGAVAHAPFLSSVAPSFFNIDSFEQLPHIHGVPARVSSDGQLRQVPLVPEHHWSTKWRCC